MNYPLGDFGRSAPPEAPKKLLFTHANIWTCSGKGLLADASLLIGNGKILAVGVDLPVPEGAVVIDLAGKHISPGIIDCHSHMATDGGINETGQAITAEVRIGDFIDARRHQHLPPTRRRRHVAPTSCMARPIRSAARTR